jgi:hypothetical protein
MNNFLGTRLGCSWQQSGKSLNPPYSNTDSKRTAIQKPGNNAKTFRISQVVAQKLRGKKVALNLHAHAQHWTQGLGAHGKALKQPCFSTDSTRSAMLNAKTFQYSLVVQELRAKTVALSLHVQHKLQAHHAQTRTQGMGVDGGSQARPWKCNVLVQSSSLLCSWQGIEKPVL